MFLDILSAYLLNIDGASAEKFLQTFEGKFLQFAVGVEGFVENGEYLVAVLRDVMTGGQSA